MGFFPGGISITEPSEDYFNLTQLATLWKNSTSEAFAFAHGNGVRFYRATELPDTGMHRVEKTALAINSPDGYLPEELVCLRKEVRGINQDKHTVTRESAPRRSTIHKHAVQEIAIKLWNEYPSMTQDRISSHNEIHTYLGEQEASYADRTLISWLREVDPRPKKKRTGRPRKA